MVRKTKAETEKTRLGILNAALDVIYEKGYSGTNLNDIAAKLGVTRGAVYWHFKNKEDLFWSLIKEIEEEFDELVEKRARSVQTLDSLQAFFVYIAELYVADDRMFKYMTVLSIKIEWNEELKRVVKFLRKQSSELEKFCLYVLKKAEKNGELCADLDKQLAAKSLVALMDGCMFTLVPPFGTRDTDIIKNALGIFFRGLSK